MTVALGSPYRCIGCGVAFAELVKQCQCAKAVGYRRAADGIEWEQVSPRDPLPDMAVEATARALSRAHVGSVEDAERRVEIDWPEWIGPAEKLLREVGL